MKRFDKLIKISNRLIDLPDSRSNKHFSYLLIRNKIISMGYNLSFTSHPIAHKYGYRFDAQHSELKCLLNAPYPPSIFNRCTLINIRIMSNGLIGISKPCPKCQQLLRDFNINRIYFTNREGEFERL
jgi:hypothetical protein